MIEHYELRKVQKEEVLVLYLNYHYEFAGEDKDDSLLQKINHYIKMKHIKWNGNKVILVVGGLVLGSLVLGKINIPEKNYQNQESFDYVSSIILNHFNDSNETIGYSKIDVKEPVVIEEVKEDVTPKEESPKSTTNKNTSNNTTASKPSTPPIVATPPAQEVVTPPTPEPIVIPKTMVTVYRSNGTVQLIELEEYIIGVVAAEMPASFHIEALKAQSIAARTYALKAIQEGNVLTDDVRTQSYKDNNQLRVMWGTGFNTYYNKVKTAVEATKGMVMTYNGNYITALYHSTSNGYTENSYEVFGYSYPYLSSVNSAWDINANSFLRQTIFAFEDLQRLTGIDFTKEPLIEIIERTSSGRVATVRIGDNYYTGVEFRNLLGLRSADFDINIDNNKVIITTRGYGHGVGMSQYGANGMANSGKNYTEILKHYYQGVTIKSL